MRTYPTFVRPEDIQLEMLEDIRSMLAKPELLADVVAGLRRSMRATLEPTSKHRWRNIREVGLRRALARLGFVFRSRPHASGNAVYIWTGPFEQVVDFHGRVHNVSEI